MAIPALHLADAAVTGLVAPSCPSCRTTSTVCTSKTPSTDAYWRCERCGDVWNPARVATDLRGWRA